MARPKKEKPTCNYPDCFNCTYVDCIMTDAAIKKIIRERSHTGLLPDESAERNKKSLVDGKPHCTECKDCAYVQKAHDEGLQRICLAVKLPKIIENKTANCPNWCPRRGRENEK